MPQSLCQIYLHIVFSTKDRKRYFQDRLLREQTHRYVAGICRNLECLPIIVGGVEDHIHILCRLAKTVDVSKLIREIKRDSSKWVKEQSPDMASFYWQSGYGAFSISPAHVELLTMYIANQEEHHTKETFQEEFRRLLRKYHVEFDEQYLWDRNGLCNSFGVGAIGDAIPRVRESATLGYVMQPLRGRRLVSVLAGTTHFLI